MLTHIRIWHGCGFHASRTFGHVHTAVKGERIQVHGLEEYSYFRMQIFQMAECKLFWKIGSAGRLQACFHLLDWQGKFDNACALRKEIVQDGG